MTTHTTGPLTRTGFGRGAYWMIATVLLAAIATETITHDTGYWQIAAFGFAPNSALLARHSWWGQLWSGSRSRLTGCWQVWQRPVQHLNRGWNRRIA
jgi:hypothetical protein